MNRGVAHVWIGEAEQSFSLPDDLNSVIRVIAEHDLFPREIIVELETGQVIPFTEYVSMLNDVQD